MKKLFVFCIILISLSLFGLEILPDPGNLTGYRGKIGEVYYFEVTGSERGSIWGTDIYTDDTTLAVAVVHAGLLKVGETGVIVVEILEGMSSYEGSNRNDIASNSYGGWHGSYQIKLYREEKAVLPETISEILQKLKDIYIIQNDSERLKAYDDFTKLFLDVKTDTLKIGDQLTHNIGNIAFKMRLAPASTFPTGLKDDKEHTVEKRFWIAETLVTYELWYEVKIWAEKNGYVFTSSEREGSHGVDKAPPTFNKNNPVTKVNWTDSYLWTNALSEMMGLEPVYRHKGEILKTRISGVGMPDQTDANGFRLPTEKEWELAARFIGEVKPSQSPLAEASIFKSGYYWTPGSYASGAYADTSNSAELKEVAWYSSNSSLDGTRTTQNVGLLRANQLGLYDMSGNVAEWLFYKRVGSPSDMRGLMGGSYNQNPDFMRISLMSFEYTGVTYNRYGFRIVRNAE